MSEHLNDFECFLYEKFETQRKGLFLLFNCFLLRRLIHTCFSKANKNFQLKFTLRLRIYEGCFHVFSLVFDEKSRTGCMDYWQVNFGNLIHSTINMILGILCCLGRGTKYAKGGFWGFGHQSFGGFRGFDHQTECRKNIAQQQSIGTKSCLWYLESVGFYLKRLQFSFPPREFTLQYYIIHAK